MLNYIRNQRKFKTIQRSLLYSRFRRYFPMKPLSYNDDRFTINNAEIVTIDWPAEVKKPIIGIVRDYGEYPRWTKYVRFLENNSFNYDYFDILRSDWIDKAKRFNSIIGASSSEHYILRDLQKKYYFIDNYLQIPCYPSSKHALLFEDKCLEAYLAVQHQLPFIKSYISNDYEEALQIVHEIKYPIVSKINPSSGSYGVELVKSEDQALRIVQAAFSNMGRKTNAPYLMQKNYIFFQEYVQNDGYDLRVIVIGKYVFGFYRKILEGDFRASGMGLFEKRELPEEAIRIACRVYDLIQSPMLAVDMLRDMEGKYQIIEYSPFCRIRNPEMLEVNGKPGIYVLDPDHSYHFEEGRYWLPELALREFLLKDYLPKFANQANHL